MPPRGVDTMNNHSTDAASVELLPTSQSDISQESRQEEAVYGQQGSDQGPAVPSKASDDQHTARSRQKFWLPVAEASETIAFCVLIVAVIPIILLAIFAPRLAARLSSSSCLPNGDFIIPGTASIWNPRYIFTISIGFGSHSYTYVKIIDAIWDVVVGRGGQLILVWLAYRTFHKSLMYVMQSQPIPYSLYGAVAFDAGSLHSIIQFVQTLTTSEAKRSWRITRIYITIALCTLYIAAMPTLFSAMTGYAAISTPSIEAVNGFYRGHASPELCAEAGIGIGNCTILPCGSSLQPVWAIVWDSARYGQDEPYWVVEEGFHEPHPPSEYTYYMAHESDYLAAAGIPECSHYYNGSSLDDCAPLQKFSRIHDPFDLRFTELEPPLLNIDVLGKNAQGAPKALVCGGFPFFTKDINAVGENAVSALCTAGSSYQWGFSFLLLLIVSILNLAFAATMYGLWVDVRRKGDLKTKRESVLASGRREDCPMNTPSSLRSALDISRQAEVQYGKDVHDWPSWKLDRVVWRGNKGIRLQDVV